MSNKKDLADAKTKCVGKRVTVTLRKPANEDWVILRSNSRKYRYIICNTPTRPAQLAGLVTWYKRPLNVETMDSAGQLLLGECDFAAFQAASCQSPTSWRNMTHVSISRRGDFVIIDLEANAFLHHMVRNIVCSLLLVGSGLRSKEWFAGIFAGKDRTVAGDTAASAGLYLVSVSYPEGFGIPCASEAPTFLSFSV